ncbi:MAG TPA: sulfurtransferase TusA family protein [Bacillota bacterium]|nr:sulfurtransferase TusA family protein [Bacillota bacterium]
MAYRVDARGLSCPQPVVMTKRALEATRPEESGVSQVLEVLVDNHTAMENVSRFARHRGFDVQVEVGEEGDDCCIVRIYAKGLR